MTVNEKLVNWILKRVENDYADDIALILLYGSYVNGTANEKSDVDCYFIPRTERGYQFAADFIIQDIGYDIFPMNWERVERIAELKEVIVPCVGDVQVLFYHSSEELERFKKLQKLLQDNLNNQDYAKKIAKEKFESVCPLYSELMDCDGLMEARILAGNIIMTLADAVAVYNQEYYHFGLKKQFEDLQKFEYVPANFIEEYENVIKSEKLTDVKLHCQNLVKAFAEFTAWELPEDEKQKETLVAEEESAKEDSAENQPTDFYFLARLYEEISSTFNKIYVCAENGNYRLAFLSAVCLQGELQEISQEQGVVCYDILSAYDYNDLTKLAETTRKVEQAFIQLITESGEKINKFSDFEDFERAKL